MNRVTIRDDTTGEVRVSASDLTEALKRLALYEDSGIDPEDIISVRDMLDKNTAELERRSAEMRGSVSRGVRLLRADQEQRLIELPCRLGGQLWQVRADTPVAPWTVRRFRLTEDNAIRLVNSGQYGRTVFSTRMDAQAALQRLRAQHSTAQAQGA